LSERPAGEECERRVLGSLVRLLQSRIDAMSDALSLALAPEPVGGDGKSRNDGIGDDNADVYGSSRCLAARVYLQGQDALLREALNEVRSLEVALSDGGVAHHEDGGDGMSDIRASGQEEATQMLDSLPQAEKRTRIH